MPRIDVTSGSTSSAYALDSILQGQAPASLNQIATQATERAQTLGRSYALTMAPTSPNPRLSGNHVPEHTPISWLKNRYKCNQFVGDVLFRAGFEMPSYVMPDGSEHYVNAEALKKFTRHFHSVPSVYELRPGDLLVLDRLNASGENGAHVEIISHIDLQNSSLHMIGARRDGASSKDYSSLLRSLQLSSGNIIRDAQGRLTEVIALRPRVQRSTSTNLGPP